jgi:hypothetical protein
MAATTKSDRQMKKAVETSISAESVVAEKAVRAVGVQLSLGDCSDMDENRDAICQI